ncbi:MAG: hypothetical protein UY96_C0015G0010 [Parcubacteria group bacterium GW2011_GWB1_56_8]|nr:MAG: hypothetical protein UY96_C0015G0010 [Parcubacteria group bacterium GW2011_GWB1_56_8]
MRVEHDGDITRKSVFQDGKMYMEIVQDISAYLKRNAELRAERSGMDKFKKAMVAKHLMHSASIPTGFVAQMRNGQCCTDGKSYDLYSSDRDEIRRALLHVQLYHPAFMVVDAKVFSSKHTKW